MTIKTEEEIFWWGPIKSSTKTECSQILMINTYKGWLFKLFCMHVLIAVESFVIGFSYNCGVCFQIQNVEKWKVLQLRGQRLVWRKSTRNNGVFLCWAESSAPWEGRLAVCGNVGINPLSVFKFLGFMPAMYQIGWEAGLQENWDIDVGRSLLMNPENPVFKEMEMFVVFYPVIWVKCIRCKRTEIFILVIRKYEES